jgi:uncharacterized protein YjbJ (UPF0337 family)
MGNIEERIGHVTGLDSLKTSGQERRVQGDTEHKQAQSQGYTEGVKDRAVGAKDQLAGSVTGDTSQETSGMSYHFTRLDGQCVYKCLSRPRSQRTGKDPTRLEQVVNYLLW